MNQYLAALLGACLVATPAHADAARYHRYWQEAAAYAKAGFAEADKAVAVMKTDHDAYCFQLSQVRNELQRATKLFIYAFEQIDADTELSDDERTKLEPMIEDYKSIKSIQDRYIALQETRCLAGPSYSDTIPSIDDSSSDNSWDDDSDDNEDWDDSDWDDDEDDWDDGENF